MGWVIQGDFLKTYTQYINNYDAAQNAVAKCSQDNPRFQRWLEETRNDPLCKGLGLQSYLIMPVQRVPRYSLLLRVRSYHLIIPIQSNSS
jgi:FYVE/RhoGEF/PH domain-containing protein 5/6